MPTSLSNPKLQYEAGQTPYAMAALNDSGDQTIFAAAAAPWSRRSGYTPVIRPDGLITGGTVIPAVSGSDDVIDCSAATCYIGGALVSIDADTDVAITRGSGSDTHCITSITLTAAGAVAAVAGTASTAFSETRAAAGGPPLIPTTSIEIAQVRTTSITAAAIESTEIYATPGTHLERYDYPVISEYDYRNGELTFGSALPLIHTGAVTKGVYASYYTPTFSTVGFANDFVPPEESHSVSSTQTYDGAVGNVTNSLSQGSFTAMLTDGITDSIIGLKGERLWFRFYSDKLASPYNLSQGILGVSRTFSMGQILAAKCTISAESASVDVNV